MGSDGSFRGRCPFLGGGGGRVLCQQRLGELTKEPTHPHIVALLNIEVLAWVTYCINLWLWLYSVQVMVEGQRWGLLSGLAFGSKVGVRIGIFFCGRYVIDLRAHTSPREVFTEKVTLTTRRFHWKITLTTSLGHGPPDNSPLLKSSRGQRDMSRKLAWSNNQILVSWSEKHI